MPNKKDSSCAQHEWHNLLGFEERLVFAFLKCSNSCCATVPRLSGVPTECVEFPHDVFLHVCLDSMRFSV